MLKDLRNTAIENRRILVIDDNLAIHEDFRKNLGDDYRPRRTRSGGSVPVRGGAGCSSRRIIRIAFR